MAISNKLTEYVNAVTIVTTDVANSWYGGLFGTTEGDALTATDPLVAGHIHDGQHLDGHAQKVSLVSHITGQLLNANLADDSVNIRNVQSFIDPANAIPVSEMIGGDEYFYLDLSSSCLSLDGVLATGNVTGGTDIIVEDNDSIDYGTSLEFTTYFEPILGVLYTNGLDKFDKVVADSVTSTVLFNTGDSRITGNTGPPAGVLQTGSFLVVTGEADSTVGSYSGFSGNISLATGPSRGTVTGSGGTSWGSGDVSLLTGLSDDSDSGSVRFITGKASLGTSGAAVFVTGNGTDSGGISFLTGNANGGDAGGLVFTGGTSFSGNSNDVSLTSGVAETTSGSVIFESGTSVNGTTGAAFVGSGDSAGANTGILTLKSGDSTTNTSTGNVRFESGTSAAGTGTGSVIVASGLDTSSGSTGDVFVESGTVTTGSTGTVTVRSGLASGTGTTGKVRLESGSALVGAGIGTGLVTVTSGEDSGAGITGGLNLTTGAASGGTTGDITIETGADAGAGTSGDINLTVGASASGTKGAINVSGRQVLADSATGTGLIWYQLGTTATEGLTRVVYEETISPSAIETAVVTIPMGSIVDAVWANVETTLVGGGTTDTWSLGLSGGDLDAYGTSTSDGFVAQTADLTQNSKFTALGGATPLAPAGSSIGLYNILAQAIVLTGCEGAGVVAGDTALTVGSIRIRIAYRTALQLDDA